MGAGLDYMHSRGIIDAAVIAAIGPTLDEGRVWLPWRDAENHQIYRSGRSINGGEPKYKNQSGPKPPLFASPGAWQSPEVILVEGQFDAIAAAQAGKPAFATTTSSLHVDAVKILAAKRRVIIVPDRDEAGERWREDVVNKLAHLVDLYEAVVPEGFKDLAEVAERAESDPGEAVFDILDAWVSLNSTPFIDWHSFWTKDRRASEWLFEPVLAMGRAHSMYATHKMGKSLFLVYLCAQLATQGDTAVIYLDYEMTEDDLYERLEDMGYGAGTDFSLLRYALLPAFAPLNTADGASELMRWVDGTKARWPDKNLAVVIDTTSRAVSGPENDADTIQAFYRHTGLALKQRGATWVRLDHAGKDSSKGQRGTSAKGDDVDVVWKLAKVENGIQLQRDLSRMGWVPEKVNFRREDEPLRYIEVAEGWPAGTGDLVTTLDELGIDSHLSKRETRTRLADVGIKARESLILAAQKFRRIRQTQSLEGAE